MNPLLDEDVLRSPSPQLVEKSGSQGLLRVQLLSLLGYRISAAPSTVHPPPTVHQRLRRALPLTSRRSHTLTRTSHCHSRAASTGWQHDPASRTITQAPTHTIHRHSQKIHPLLTATVQPHSHVQIVVATRPSSQANLPRAKPATTGWQNRKPSTRAHTMGRRHGVERAGTERLNIPARTERDGEPNTDTARTHVMEMIRYDGDADAERDA